MSDLRRQKRKAVRESKKNLTGTKIDDNLAIALDDYLKNPIWFEKQLDLCYELKLDYPPEAKSGYELPLFNKNPITNEIEIHSKSAELFIAFQLIQNLAESTIGMDDASEEFKLIEEFIGLINLSSEFAGYLHGLLKTGEEKEKSFTEVLNDNSEEIHIRIKNIVSNL